MKKKINKMQEYALLVLLSLTLIIPQAEGSCVSADESRDLKDEITEDASYPSRYIPSGIIRASEIANPRILGCRSQILGGSFKYGFFVEQDGPNLVCKNLKLETLVTFPVPVIAGKTLIDAQLISNRFVRLTFGIYSPDKKRKEIMQNVDTRHIKCYESCEDLIWDLTPGKNSPTFKVENPEFGSVSLLLSGLNNHERVLAKEHCYLKDGNNGYSRYRFYNLTTRSFHDTVVFDFNPISTSFFISNDANGNCIPLYAYQGTEHEKTFKKVEITADGKFSLPNTIFLLDMGTRYFNVENGMLIFNKAGSRGFQVPFLVDLKRSSPIEKCLLNDDEVESLTSDVYNAKVNQGMVTFTLHFDKPQVILRELAGTEVGPKANVMKYLYDKLKSQYSAFLFPEVWEIFSGGFNELLSWEQERLQQLFSSPLLKYILEKSLIFPSRIRPTQSGVLRTADGRFNMPIYYTEPETPNPKGWFIVDIHGGPHVREFNELDMEQQFWTSRGLPHFRPNIRGSSGFGADYREASDGKWWDVVDDVRAVIEWVRARGLGVNPIVIGTSFGAYASTAAFAKGYTNHAIAVNGLYDLVKQYCSPGQASEQYGANEAIRKANSVTTHLEYNSGEVLLFAGLKDDACLPEQSETLFAAMDGLGISAELITMAEAGHYLYKPADLLMMLRAQERFVAKITGSWCEPSDVDIIAATPGAVSRKTRAAMGYGPRAMVVSAQR